MIELWIAGSALAVGSALWIYNGSLLPRMKTRPPAEKILNLVKNEDGFSVFSKVKLTKIEQATIPHPVDYVLMDNVRAVRSYLYLDEFHGSVKIHGDLEWMNEWERERLFLAVAQIAIQRMKKYNEACKVEQEARHERQRQEAIKIYENR